MRPAAEARRSVKPAAQAVDDSAARKSDKPIAPTVEASAAKVRQLLGASGEPIAEGMMALKGEVAGLVNEMRAYANGAGEAAREAKTEAARSATALEQAEKRNDSLVAAIDKKTDDMRQQVKLAEMAADTSEEALTAVRKETTEVNASIKALKSTDAEGKPVTGVAALQAIERKANGVEDAAQKAVDNAASIIIITTKTDKGTGKPEAVTKTLHGKDAFQYVSERVDYAARTAGDAIKKVDELKTSFDALDKAVADAFETVDKKLRIVMKMLERTGADVPQAVKDAMSESSYNVGGKNG
jgi:uracil phosphoribosyltransferase